MSTDNILRVTGDLTIERAFELKDRFLQSVEEIDLSGVTAIDTAGLQLLIMAKREAIATGRELRLTRHSQAVLEVFDLLGMAAYFGDHLVMDSHDSIQRS